MLDRETMRKYMATRRAEWKARGLCVDCGTKRNDERYLRCDACREKARRRVKKWKSKR